MQKILSSLPELTFFSAANTFRIYCHRPPKATCGIIQTSRQPLNCAQVVNKWLQKKNNGRVQVSHTVGHFSFFARFGCVKVDQDILERATNGDR